MILSILVLVLLVTLVYRKTLSYQFVVDDFESVRCNCKEPDIFQSLNFQRMTEYDKNGKPKLYPICKKCGLIQRNEPKNFLQYFWWNVAGLQYTDLKFAHRLVLVIHAINSVLIYLVFGHNPKALLIAGMFAIHPVTTQGSSIWLSGKGYGLAAMSILLMLLFPALAFIFYPIGVFFSFGVMLAPFIFIRTQWWFWVFLIPLVLFFRRKHFTRLLGWRHKLMSEKTAFRAWEWNNIILFFKVTGYNFCLCLFPVKLGIHPTYLGTYGATHTEKKYWLKLDWFFALGVILVYIGATNFFFNYNQTVFGLTWFFIFILPFSQLIAGPMFISERYCLLPLIGILSMLVNLVLDLPLTDVAKAVIFTAFFMGYYMRLLAFMPFYESLLRCTEENIRNFPGSVQAWVWKGGVEKRLGLYPQAYSSWLTAWHLRPFDFRINNNLSAMLMGMGMLKEAGEYLDRAAACPAIGLENVRDFRVKVLRTDLARRMIKAGLVGNQDLCPCKSGKPVKHCVSDNHWEAVLREFAKTVNTREE